MQTNYQALNQEQLTGYLKRLGISGPEEVQPTRAWLDRLVELHQKRIPFEDIDVYQQKLPISLDVSDLYDKIISRNRGGYCYELNGLFIALLQSLHFDAWSCFCRVIRGRSDIRPISHRGNLVNLDGALYYCDVGFGGPMPAGALLVEDGKHQIIGQEEYWVKPQEHGWWAIMRRKRGHLDDYDPDAAAGEQMELLFQNAMADPADFLPLSAYSSGVPTSLFRTKYMVNMRTDSGYKDISDNIFTVKEGDEVTRVSIEDETMRFQILKEQFGIVPEE